MKTNHHSGPDRKSATRGSALIIVIMLCAFTLVLVGTYLKTLSNVSRISYRSTLQNEGRNAAEGVSEYVLAEMHRRSQANPSFGAGANPNPLSGFTLSTADINFIAPGTGNSRVVPASIAFKNSVLSNAPSIPQAIDSEDPVNAQDPSIDQTPLSIRSLNIFAKASVLDPQTNTQVKSFVSTNVQIRDQTWFNYAIFYNMDLELHAGPNFTVFGPVHTNATCYAMAGGGSKLQFFSTLTAVGNIYRYNKYSSAIGTHTGTVECSTKTGMLAANLLSMATNRDSTYASFHDYATSRWKSFVQDDTFSVPKFNPPGMKEYVPENFSTGAVELRNNGYLMIEPQLSKVTSHVDPYTGINDFGYKGLDSENLKFSALSGFIIQVKQPTAVGTAANSQPQWQLVCYQATDTTKRISADNPPARDSTTGLPIIATIINPFTDKDDIDYPAADAVIKRSLKIALLNAIVSVPYRDGGASAAAWGNSTSALSSFTQAAPATTINGAAAFTTALAGTHYPIYDRREGHNYTTAGGSAYIAMRGAMHVIKIDFVKLNALLNDNTGLWLRPYGSTAYVYQPSASYTGVVYVQFPLAPITTSRFPSPVGSTANGDMIRPALGADPAATPKLPGYSVLLTNAGTVPQMTIGSEPPDGFTIATNGMLYVWGHFNADGNSGTGSSILPDSASERPALIAADAVTVLSANAGYGFSSMYNTKHAANNFTEVSAAIITGLHPTQPGTNLIWSGGVHNLVRLLEDWNSDYRFRGSLGVLFEHEVAKGRYNEGFAPYYDPPNRDMGYHQYLSQGRFPPATPIKRTVRRMNLQDITEAEYNAGPTKPPAFN